MTTAREFVKACGLEVTERTLYWLSQYINSQVDFSQFPDAIVLGADGNPLEEQSEEPAGFQEYLEIQHAATASPGIFADACGGRVGWYDGNHPRCCGNCRA